MADAGHVAIGTWSGGRFMRFGEEVEEARLEALMRPGDGVHTLITADTYGTGEADAMLGRALRGVPREDYFLAGAVGHDFYEGQRDGPKGFPRFTDRRLRGPEQYGAYLETATRRRSSASAWSGSTCSCSTTPTARATPIRRCGRGWRALRERGLARSLGVAPARPTASPSTCSPASSSTGS